MHNLTQIVLQEPICTLLGSRHVWKRGTSKHRRRIMKVQDTFQYIPLLDSLKVGSKHWHAVPIVI